MLKIKTSNDWLPITNQSNYFIEYDEEGEQTLSFDLSIKDGLAKYIVNEAIIQSDNNEYLIKGINRPSYVMSVTCQLNLDDWMDGHYLKTKDIVELQTKTIDDVLEFVKPNGWTVLGKTIRTIKRTIDLEKCNRYDIMMRCKDVYNVQYDFDTIKKIVTIVDPDLKIDNGVYVTPELNMKSMAYMGTSSNLINRLYCYGADDLTFASINGGKPYVEITDFKGTPICASWTDERYTNAQDLLDDAKVKLSKMSYPSGAYTIDVIDLASLKEEYKFLEFKLRHLVHAIIDPEHKIDVIHRVVRFRDYPDEKSRNKVTLSNTPRKVNDLLSSYKESIESIEADGIHYETSIRNSSKEIELISKGLNETKLKLTSDQIMMIVSQAIKEGNSLNTVQVVIDSLGLTVKNGGIKVYDINNNLVLFVDDKSKKLIMSGFTLDTNGLSSTYVETIPNYVQADYLKIREYIMGNITLTKEEIEYLDINHDGYISAVDYTMMRNLIDFGMFTHTWVHKFKISANNPTRFIEYSCDRGNGYVQNSEVSINSISKEAFKTINSRITDIENKLIQHGW